MLVVDLGNSILSTALENCPALVLNADFRPLSYYPLSIWPWQEVIKAVFLDLGLHLLEKGDHLLDRVHLRPVGPNSHQQDDRECPEDCHDSESLINRPR